MIAAQACSASHPKADIQTAALAHIANVRNVHIADSDEPHTKRQLMTRLTSSLGQAPPAISHTNCQEKNRAGNMRQSYNTDN